MTCSMGPRHAFVLVAALLIGGASTDAAAQATSPASPCGTIRVFSL